MSDRSKTNSNKLKNKMFLRIKSSCHNFQQNIYTKLISSSLQEDVIMLIASFNMCDFIGCLIYITTSHM